MKLAPIVLFAYNRPHHLLQTLQSLMQNASADESELTIYIDHPKENTNAAVGLTSEVLVIASMKKWCNSVKIILREYNFGLAENIISGVTEALTNSEKVIVLEDDFILAEHFLVYMNNALNLYAEEPLVAAIHGYCLPVKEELPDTYFLRGTDCWGWGTWKRAWSGFEKDGRKLKKQLTEKKLIRKLNFDGTYNYYGMLCDQIQNKNNSWAVRWHAYAIINNMITLHPGKSLVKNIGLDDSGVHSKFDDRLIVDLFDGELVLEKLKPEENIEMFNVIKNYYKSSSTFFEKFKLYIDTFR